MSAPSRRKCAGPCGKNRSPEFFTSARGRICTFCQKKKRRETARGAHVRRTYDMTPEQAKKLLNYQGGACAICDGERDYNLPLDHDHSLPDGMESWRGFLCKRCNKLLRDVRDDVQVLLAAAEYLRNPPARKVFAECLSPLGSTVPEASASS